MVRRIVMLAAVVAVLFGGISLAPAGERAAAISNDPDLLEMVNDALANDGFSVLASSTVSEHVVAEKVDVTDVAENEELLKRIAAKLYEANAVKVLVVAVSSGEEVSHNADLGTYLYKVRVTVQAVYTPTGAILVRKSGSATGSSSARDKAAIKARNTAAKDALEGIGAAISAKLKDSDLVSKRLTVRLTRIGPRTYDSAGRAFARIVESIPGVKDLKRTYDSAKKELNLSALFSGDAKVLEEKIRDAGAMKDVILESSTEDTLIFTSTLQEVSVAVTGALADNVRSAGLEVFKGIRTLPATSEAQWNYEYSAGEFRVTSLYGGTAAEMHELLTKELTGSPVAKDLKLMETRQDKLTYKFGGDLIRVKVEGLSHDFYEETGRALANLIEKVQGVEDTRRYFDAVSGQLVISVVYGGGAKTLEEALRGEREGLGELTLLQSTDDSLTFKLAVREIDVTVAGTAASAVKSAGETMANSSKEIAKSVTWAFDEVTNLFSIKMLFKGNVNELYSQLTQRIEKTEIARDLFLVRALDNGLAYRYGEIVNQVSFVLAGLNAESYAKVGEVFFSAVKDVPKMTGVKKSYSEKEGVLTITGVFPGTVTEADDLVWQSLRRQKEMEDVVADSVDNATSAYRWQSGEVAMTLDIANMSPARYAEIGKKVESIVGGLANAKITNKSYKEDTHILKFELTFRGRQFELENSFWAAARGEESLVDLMLVDSAVNTLSYALPPSAEQTLALKLTNVSADTYKTTGQAFLQVIESLPGVAKVEKNFDAEKKEVQVRLSFKGRPVDLDSRLWSSLANDPAAFANIYPGTIEGAALTYAFKEAVKEPVAMVWRVKGIKAVDAPEVRRATLGVLGGIAGVEVVADEYNATTEELVIEFGFKGRPIEFRKPFADGIAKARELGLIVYEETVGNVITYSMASEKQGVWQLDALLANFDEEKDVETGKAFTDTIGAVKGVTEVQQKTVPESDLLVVSFSYPGKAIAFEKEARARIADKKELAGLRPIRVREDLLEYSMTRPEPAQPTGVEPTATTTTALQPPVVVPPATEPLPDLSKLVEEVGPSVVYIEGATGKEGEIQWLGSGFIVSPRGYVITNEHVVSAEVDGKKVDQAQIKLRVKTIDGRWFDAKVLGTDVEADLALLKIKGSDLPSAKLGSTEKMKAGQDIFIIGNPLGLEHSLTTGIVSGMNRMKGRIQTNALINQGNSGGPAFDMGGEVVGIAVGGAVQLCNFGQERVEVPYPGVNFIIPVEQARELMEKVAKQLQPTE
ncbi:MAG: trypsin-like peptidase domain-containing protein [Planctomycetota bacterium]|nr:trypsin-like peptidase domain-containing protein [Planctomycetota bacterium]